MMTFINGFEKGEPDYLLAIDVPTKLFKAKFEKNEDDNFVLKFENSTDETLNAEYFFKMPAVLRAPGFMDIILMNSDAISFSQSLGDPQEIKVVYKSFSTEADPSLWAKSKHCAYFKYSKKDFRFTHFALQFEVTTHKDRYKSWKNAIALKASPQSDILVSFDESLPGDDAYCIFRSQKAMEYATFERYIEAVKTTIGILGGYYFGDRAYFLSDYSKNPPKDKTPLIIRYRNTGKAIMHKYPLLDANHYHDVEPDQLMMKADQFKKLTELLVENDDYLRALKLLIDAASIDGTSRGAIAAVALESIANNLNVKGPALFIIKDKQIASQLRYELGKALKVVKPRISKEDYKRIESKVGSVNVQPNAVKLESCFEKLGIILSEEEAFCISCRNYFLHGGLPKNKDLSFLTKDELVFMVSQRLIMLSTMLLLKIAGYNGLVTDWGFTVVVKVRAIREGRPFLRQGNAHRQV